MNAPQPTDQPAWIQALAAALGEAVPRLHGANPDPLVGELIEALAVALAEGQLEIPVPSARHRQALAGSPLCAAPHGPLALDGDRLLWRRWQRQRDGVLQALIARAQRPLQPAGEAAPADGLDRDQQRAVSAVLRYGLVLLEGGPGTGKTSTVARMLAAVQVQQPGSRIHLAAPTGKAAARLRAALANANLQLPCSTLHRLLESRGERFGRNRDHPLALDLLVVDEVSMVDLPLMEALLDALPQDCRLVLVGDAAQLPPVGPGPVLLDLQAPERRQALGDAAIGLRTTYRNNGAIAAVAAALRAGHDPLEAWLPSLLEPLPADANLRWLEAPPRSLPAALLERLRRHQEQLEQRCRTCPPDDPAAAAALLAALEACLVLTPLRRGRWGVEAIHQALLGEAASRSAQHWPVGTPVLCRHNLVELGLANGDVGLVMEQPGRSTGERRLLFSAPGQPEPLWIHPAQLPDAEPALALTVHKAQGSEADEVWVLMPDKGRPQRRLLYTALTRARQQARLITPLRAPAASASLAP
ncbi:AAA family ATPase [Cyanobium sp. FACHB-13342]|uniref:AAA family ATPase n=1 Tax=Cyanobium sp. FACHB-13342 TaxID=2692793 RepID=UPI001681A153|nr:AAA family ATPase [Cyanobium sp. FACHB-13342]MBD2423692.1 AAA family ATPase [Cyanobium sp. FACHB-13342]